jgi:ubiquitin-conjugating enzyme E2 D/E
MDPKQIEMLNNQQKNMAANNNNNNSNNQMQGNNMPSMMNNMQNMNMNNMNNMNMMRNNMANNMNNNMGMNQMNSTLTRLKKEYELCSADNELSLIGCSFALVDNNYYKWKVTIIGPKGTPYENGLFFIQIIFPEDYPKNGAEFRFINQIYHLNVDLRKESFGHICLSSLNEWKNTGKVAGKSCYGVKQALFDIFYLFFTQGVESPYSDEMKELYQKNRTQFEENAREWTKKYANMG